MAATKRKLDFRGVKDQSNFKRKHYPEGDYKGKILEVNDHESDNGEGWVFTIQVKSGKYPYYVMTYNKKSLWKVRNLFIAAGLKVPKKLLAVDPNRVVGKEIGVTLEDDEYEGRMQSSIDDVLPLSDLMDADMDDADEDDEEVEEDEDIEVEEEDDDEDEDDDEEEEEPKPKKKAKSKAAKGKKKKAKPADDDEDEEVDDEDLEEMDIEEI